MSLCFSDFNNLTFVSLIIVVAEMQHVTYNEWLPIILGSEFMDSHGLSSLSSGYSFAYFGCDINYDPRVANAFATAAFRFGHSLIPANFKVQFVRRGTPVTSYRLHTAFFQPTEFREDGANNGDMGKCWLVWIGGRPP